MFTALKTLLAQVVSLAVSMVANEDGTITVTVIPKAKQPGDANASLNTPLVLTGTAEELDAEFVNLLASYTSKRVSLAEQLEATEAILEAAKKDSAAKATKAVAKGAAKPDAKAKSSSEKGSDDGVGDGDDAGGSAVAPTQTDGGVKSAEAAPSNIWD